jgi:hypothetical protein
MTCARAEDALFEQYILGLEIAMDQLRLTKEGQSGQELLRKHPNQSGAEAAELVLLDQLVQVDAK